MARLQSRGVAACLALGLAACQGSAQVAPPPAELVIAYPAGPPSLAPNVANDGYSLAVLANVYEPLVDLDAQARIRPALAESWHNEDERSWVFLLREGVRRHDGRLVDAAAVAESLREARDAPESRRRAELAPVESIEVRDARTLVLRTRRPYPGLPVRLGLVAVGFDAAESGLPAVGTGPYRVTAWEPHGTTRLEAFREHWGAAPRIERVRYQVLPEEQERLRQLVDGRVHVLIEIPTEAMERLAETPEIRTLSRRGLRVLFLAMDCARERNPHLSTETNPFRDVRVRRALALAVEREALVEQVLGGFAETVDQLASPIELGGAQLDLPPRPHDPEAARELLAAAGFRDGFEVALDYMPERFRSGDAVVLRLAAGLEAVGIRVEARPNGSAEFFERVESRDTALYLFGWSSYTGDPGLSYEYLLHSPGGGLGLDNGGGFEDREVDRLIELASMLSLPADRAAALRELARRVHDQVPVVPLYRQDDLYAVSARLRFEPRMDGRVRAAELAWAAEP